MKFKPIDIVEARRLFAFDPQTGVFVWAVSRRGPARLGDVAGTPNKDGYWMITINGDKFLASRVAWAVHYGRQPVGEVDHRNGVRTDNRIDNLREATRGQNCQNTKATGVRFEPSRNKWLARICVDYTEFNLGRYDTQEEALAARKAAALMLFGEYARETT